MSQFSDYARENLLAAQRQASTIEDRDTRMAVQSLIHVVQTFTATQERREHMRRVSAMTKLSPKTIPEPDTAPTSSQSIFDMERDQVGRRWWLTWRESGERRVEGPTVWPHECIRVMPVDEHIALARRIVAARAALSEYIALCHQRGLSGYVPEQIMRADRALKGLDIQAWAVHTDGMDTVTTEQED